uniref:Uncharacterized protein n=1 Tax=Arundo donax TaxID=35708 RepID=A0A0A9GTM7_ARUDO
MKIFCSGNYFSKCQ